MNGRVGRISRGGRSRDKMDYPGFILVDAISKHECIRNVSAFTSTY